MLVYFEDRCLVATSVAIVGCAENRDHVLVMRPAVALGWVMNGRLEDVKDENKGTSMTS